MKIVINNCSSPGASFTDNTDKVILSCYQWVSEHLGEIKPFIEFRKEASEGKHFNDNNARNIYPLLQNMGFISYSKILNYDKFFTNTGKAYAKIIETEILINDSEYDTYKKRQSLLKLKESKQELVYRGVKCLFNKDTNYIDQMKLYLKYLLKYTKINKTEFAYMLYCYDHNVEEQEYSEIIDQYRNSGLKIDVEIEVRNDIELRKRSGAHDRKEGLSYLTAYNYFNSLFEQAGLIIKGKNNYYCLVEESRERTSRLVEV